MEINIVNIRDFGVGRHKIVDDTPYGGGIGMVMRADVLQAAIAKLKTQNEKQHKEKVVLLSASGKVFKQSDAKNFSKIDHLILICGHYEGVDERIMKYVDEEVSIGDFVVTGGEIPAMLITDCVSRLVSGVLKEGVTDAESFSLRDNSESTLLEYPHFTKPQVFNGDTVPDVLLSGNHKKIDDWRIGEAQKKTLKQRPDLLKK